MSKEDHGLVLKEFVLKPKDPTLHGYASRMALLTYAEHIESGFPVLAGEIREWVAEETANADGRFIVRKARGIRKKMEKGEYD